LQLQRWKRGARPGEITPEFVQVGDKIIVAAAPGGPGASRQERCVVLTTRDGRIVDMQGFSSRRDAERFAHRR
jgi:hypothetical protein